MRNNKLNVQIMKNYFDYVKNIFCFGIRMVRVIYDVSPSRIF